MMPGMSIPRRVVIVAPVVPFDAPPHAGGQYLQHVTRFATAQGPTTVVVPNTPVNRDTADAPGAPEDLVVVGRERPGTAGGRAFNRALTLAYRQMRKVDPGYPSLILARGLMRPGPAHDALLRADVVDLQWSESIRFARLVRRVNPRARVVGTFHDVQSQLFSRAAMEGGRRVYWRSAVWQARLHERRGVAALDEVAVFSDKDAHLLHDAPHLRVIHPPLASGDESLPDEPAGPPTVLFVAHYSREENDDGALWLLHEVWPLVAAAVPGVSLRLVGRGASEALGAAVDARTDVSATGFVEDLDAEYAAAHLAVVPLRLGAGVKFKTIEALLHGVPVVTTPVGAEGIDGEDLFAGLTDDPAALAAAMVHALTDRGPARDRARAAQAWAVAEYSLAEFEQNMTRHYGID